jgi:hypothetical protein
MVYVMYFNEIIGLRVSYVSCFERKGCPIYVSDWNTPTIESFDLFRSINVPATSLEWNIMWVFCNALFNEKKARLPPKYYRVPFTSVFLKGTVAY